MKLDKKIHLWVIILLVILGIIGEIKEHLILNFFIDFLKIPTNEKLIFTSALFLIFIASFFISKLKFKWHNYFVYGISILVILSSLLHANICNWKFCWLIDWAIIIAVVLFIFIYAISSYFKD